MVGDIEFVTWDAIAFVRRDESHHLLSATATYRRGLLGLLLECTHCCRHEFDVEHPLYLA